MPLEATRLAFIHLNMITDLREVNPCLIAKGADDVISQLHFDHYEIIYLHGQPSYVQKSIEEWLDNYEILRAHSRVITYPHRLVFGRPEVMCSVEYSLWKTGVIDMMVIARKADEVVIIDKNNPWYHDYVRAHPDYTYYKEGEKRYPDYKVTLYENLSDIALTYKNWGPKTDSVRQD